MLLWPFMARTWACTASGVHAACALQCCNRHSCPVVITVYHRARCHYSLPQLAKAVDEVTRVHDCTSLCDPLSACSVRFHAPAVPGCPVIHTTDLYLPGSSVLHGPPAAQFLPSAGVCRDRQGTHLSPMPPVFMCTTQSSGQPLLAQCSERFSTANHRCCASPALHPHA